MPLATSRDLPDMQARPKEKGTGRAGQWREMIETRNKPFIKEGDRVRFIGSSKYRFMTWPQDTWLEVGIVGMVIEYHPESPAVEIGGDTIEALPPYAVVRWDHGLGANTCISPEDEGERWERLVSQ